MKKKIITIKTVRMNWMSSGRNESTQFVAREAYVERWGTCQPVQTVSYYLL